MVKGGENNSWRKTMEITARSSFRIVAAAPNNMTSLFDYCQIGVTSYIVLTWSKQVLALGTSNTDNEPMKIHQLTSMRRIRFRFLESYHTVMVLLAVVVGVLGGLCAVGFRKFIHFVQVQAWQMPDFTIEGLMAHPPWQIILVPAAGGLLVGLITHFFAKEAKGHGVPEVMEAVILRCGRIRARVVLAKMVASGICIGTGGSVGREGPIVQIG